MSLNISVYIKINWTVVFLDCFPLMMYALQSFNSPGTPTSKLLITYTIRTLRTPCILEGFLYFIIQTNKCSTVKCFTALFFLLSVTCSKQPLLPFCNLKGVFCYSLRLCNIYS